MYPTFPSFRRQPLDAPPHRFDTLPLSVRSFPSSTGLGFTLGKQARRYIQPNRVRHPTDRGFTSDCSRPRLTATPLSSVTGRRAHAWRGLSLLCSSTLSDALAGDFSPRKSPYFFARPEDARSLPGNSSLAVTHILAVVRDAVPAGHAENSPAIHGWGMRTRSNRVPEGRLSASVVPPGLGM